MTHTRETVLPVFRQSEICFETLVWREAIVCCKSCRPRERSQRQDARDLMNILLSSRKLELVGCIKPEMSLKKEDDITTPDLMITGRMDKLCDNPSADCCARLRITLKLSIGVICCLSVGPEPKFMRVLVRLAASLSLENSRYNKGLGYANGQKWQGGDPEDELFLLC